MTTRWGVKRPLGDVKTLINEVLSPLHVQSSNYVKIVFIVGTVKDPSPMCLTVFLYAQELKLKLLWRFVMMSLRNVSK